MTARKQKQARPRPAPTTASTFAVGDQVVLDGGTSVAEILAFEGKEAVLASGPFRLRASLTRLQKVGGRPKQHVQVRQVSAVPGGLPALEPSAAEVYRRTYPRAAAKNALLYRRYPHLVEQVTRIADRLAAGDVLLPDGDYFARPVNVGEAAVLGWRAADAHPLQHA